MSPPSAETEQLTQAFHRHRLACHIDNTHTNIAIETLRQLRQDLRWPGMQTMGISQGDARARPIGRQFATKDLQHRPAAGGTPQFMATAFDQQGAQTFEQSLMGLTETGETEQAVQRLAEITQRLLRSDKCQPRLPDRLLAVQPPQAVTQRQRLDLLQDRGKTVAHTIGLAQ